MLLKMYFLKLLTVSVFANATTDNLFIVSLDLASSFSVRSFDAHTAFHERAEHLEYTVRHNFNSPGIYVGLSLEARSVGTADEIKSQLKAIPGVRSVSQVQRISLPFEFNTSVDPLLSYPNPAPFKQWKITAQESTGNLASSLQMGGIDRLHELGIKGKGVKIGIIDTGVDYRHPALGGGFGSGYKIAGGYAFVADNGTNVLDSSPLTTCYGGGHGTHVAGLIGMESIPDGFDIVGVAPEAEIYAYKALDCNGSGDSDNILKAMLMAKDDGVDIVSMSIGIGAQSFNGDVNPLAEATKSLTDAGIAVVIAMSNDVGRGSVQSALYAEEWPSTEPSAIAVGAIANKDFPLVYSAVDSQGSTIKYASIWPIDLPNGAAIYMLDNGCTRDAWEAALEAVIDVNNTVFAFSVGDGSTTEQQCQIDGIGKWNSAVRTPVYILAYNLPNTEPFWQVYKLPKQGFFGTVEFINLNSTDGAKFAANYEAAGGYGKYNLTFSTKIFESPAQIPGGFVDYYSNYGPVWHTYDLKPQISAPGGNALSTFPLGTLGGYAILSGTSMATPYVAGSFALIRSQFPEASIKDILNIIQTTATPLPWIYNNSILSATAQQGAGQINVFKAIFSKSIVTPGQLLISDTSHTEYGTANITIKNFSPHPKTYSLSHQGAGYTDYRLQYKENTQQPIYGNATFGSSSVTIAGGGSTVVSFKIDPPSDIYPNRLPVFGGFIGVTSDDESFHVPYLGPPYSLYNSDYLTISSSPVLPGLYTRNSTNNAIIYDTGFLEIDPSIGYYASFPTEQWTTELRVDLLPANTTVTAKYYGFDVTAAFPTYQASNATASSSIFGFPSYGTIRRQLASSWNWPGGNSQTTKNTLVTADDGTSVKVGNGDYRFFVSILRAGGTVGVQDDYETYLGPIIRFINA